MNNIYSDYPRDFCIQIINSIDHNNPSEFDLGRVDTIARLNDAFQLSLEIWLNRFEAYRSRKTAGVRHV